VFSCGRGTPVKPFPQLTPPGAAPPRYRGTLFLRNHSLVGPYSTTIPGALWWPKRVGVSDEQGSPVTRVDASSYLSVLDRALHGNQVLNPAPYRGTSLIRNTRPPRISRSP